jgi:hypothetical protein
MIRPAVLLDFVVVSEFIGTVCVTDRASEKLKQIFFKIYFEGSGQEMLTST